MPYGMTMYTLAMRPSGSVLVIDEEPDIRTVVRMTLEKSGYRVLEATDSLDALPSLVPGNNQPPVEAIITEVGLSPIQGMEALSYFQQEHTRIPIIILTAQLDVDIRALLKNQAIVECLFKPVEIDRLTTTVERAVTRFQTSGI